VGDLLGASRVSHSGFEVPTTQRAVGNSNPKRRRLDFIADGYLLDEIDDAPPQF
jgi:hypothetical protein